MPKLSNHRPSYRIYWGVLLLNIFCFNTLLQGQELKEEPTPFSLNEYIPKEDSLIQFLQSEGLLTDLSLEQIPLFENLSQTYKGIARQQVWKNQKARKKVETRLNNRNHFFYGDTIFTQGIRANIYSSIGLEMAVSGKLPITIGGDAVFADGAFQSDLSTIAIGFDSAAFKGKLQEQFDPLIDVKSLLDIGDNPLNLTGKEWVIVQSEIEYSLYQRLTNNPKFDAYRAKLEYQLDSLTRSGADKVKAINQDSSEIQAVQVKLEKVAQVIKKYRQAWEQKSNIPFEIKETIRQKVAAKTAELKEYTNKEKVEQRLFDKKEIKGWNRFLLWTKDADLGIFDVSDTDLTARYLTLNGFRYGFDGYNKQGKGIYGEVAYGNQSLTSSFLPSLNALWLNRYYGRRFLFAKVGVRGLDESVYTQLSIVKGDEVDNPSDTLLTLPKRNIVLAWSGQARLAEHTYMNMEFGVSDQDIIYSGIADVEDRNTLSANKIAFSVHARYELEQQQKAPKDKTKNKMSIEGGYFYHGPYYYSLANPYLLTNRQGMSVRLEKEALKKRLRFSLDAKYGKAIDDTIAIGFSDYQILGELQYRFKNQNSITAQVLPNVYQQNGRGINTRSQNWIYSIQGNFYTALKNSQLLSIISLTNLQSNLTLGGSSTNTGGTTTTVADSETLQNYSYIYWQEMLLLNERQSITLTGVSGLDGLNVTNLNTVNLAEALLSMDYGHRINQLQWSIGVQVLKRQIYGEWQYGISNQVNYQFAKKVNLSLQSTYRNNWNRKVGAETLPLEQYFGSLSFQIIL